MKRVSRAVSPVIATLLLIAIAVSASVFLFGFVTSQVQSQGAQAQTQIRIDAVEFGKEGGLQTYANVTVRNSGTVDSKIQVIYITLPNSTVVRKEMATGNVVASGTTLIFTFYFNSTRGVLGGEHAGSHVDTPQGIYFNSIKGEGTSGLRWMVSTSYRIRVVTDNGFFAEGSFTTPIQ